MKGRAPKSVYARIQNCSECLELMSIGWAASGVPWPGDAWVGILDSEAEQVKSPIDFKGLLEMSLIPFLSLPACQLLFNSTPPPVVGGLKGVTSVYVNLLQ